LGKQPEVVEFHTRCRRYRRSRRRRRLRKHLDLTEREESDQPYRAIIDAALNYKCDLIVMASHGRSGMAAILLGSETVKVLTHSVIPVLVYR
jgi:nucleotide-binding universal stress UspA family protein